MRRLVFLLIIVVYTGYVTGQQEMGTHFMRSIWQTNLTNPALFPEHTFHIGLASTAFNSYQTGVYFSKYVHRNGEGVKIIDVNKALAEMPAQNTMDGNFEVQTFSASYSNGKFQIGLHHSLKTNYHAIYPKELVQLFWKGNAQFIGDTISVGPTVDILAYNELGLGASYKWKNLTIGGKAKLLNGSFSVFTDKTLLSLYTDDDIYQITAQTDYRLYSSSFVNYSGFSDTSFVPGVSTKARYNLTKNMGFAFDLGASYTIADKINLSASIIDIGEIEWKDNSKVYYSHGTFNYGGDQLLLDADSISLQGKIDSLKDILDFSVTNVNYTTPIPTKVYISAVYRINERWQVGILFYADKYRGATNTAYAVSGRYHFKKYLTVGTTLSSRYDKFDNIGIDFVVKMGAIQLYGITDNLNSVFSPLQYSKGNFRFGINVFLPTRPNPLLNVAFF